MARPTPLILRRLLGRNGADVPQDLPDHQATVVTNMDFFDGGLGRKRPGATNVTLNGFAAATNRVYPICRYRPTDAEGAAELLAVESNALTTIQRLAGGTTWATLTLANAIQTAPQNVIGVNFDGKVYLAADTAVNRLQVIPSAGGTIRRVGLAIPAAPTTVLAAGAVTDTRKYAVCWTEQSSGTTIRRSNVGTLTAAVTLSAQQVTVTRPTAPGDGETHWELIAYATGDSYSNGYTVATTVIATTTAVDNATALSGVAPPVTGANTPPPSAKFLVVDGNRLVMAGAWETTAGTGITPSYRRVWWTPRLGSSASDGDGERISDTTSVKGYLDVEAPPTGLGGPLLGNLYVFGTHHIWKLIPTDSVNAPYQRITLRDDIGCIRHQTIALSDTETGSPALYWLSAKGPYRIGPEGLQYLGRDMEDRLALISPTGYHWTLAVPELHQLWWFLATGSDTTPSEIWCFDTRLGRAQELAGMNVLHNGWSLFTGNLPKSAGGVLFANTLGATMSSDLRPYLGNENTTSAAIWKANTGSQDNGTSYLSTVTSRPYALAPGRNVAVLNDAYLMGKAVALSLNVTALGDFGLITTAAFTANLTAAGSETRVTAKVEGLSTAGISFLQFQIDDGTSATAYTLDALVTDLVRQEVR